MSFFLVILNSLKSFLSCLASFLDILFVFLVVFCLFLVILCDFSTILLSHFVNFVCFTQLCIFQTKNFNIDFSLCPVGQISNSSIQENRGRGFQENWTPLARAWDIGHEIKQVWRGIFFVFLFPSFLIIFLLTLSNNKWPQLSLPFKATNKTMCDWIITVRTTSGNNILYQLLWLSANVKFHQLIDTETGQTHKWLMGGKHTVPHIMHQSATNGKFIFSTKPVCTKQVWTCRFRQTPWWKLQGLNVVLLYKHYLLLTLKPCCHFPL